MRIGDHFNPTPPPHFGSSPWSPADSALLNTILNGLMTDIEVLSGSNIDNRVALTSNIGFDIERFKGTLLKKFPPALQNKIESLLSHSNLPEIFNVIDNPKSTPQELQEAIDQLKNFYKGFKELTSETEQMG